MSAPRSASTWSAAAAFVVNLVFCGETDYFDAAAETKPLLHLWSLGIEEQFYIAWPCSILWPFGVLGSTCAASR